MIAEKTKFVFRFREQREEKSRKKKIVHKSFE